MKLALCVQAIDVLHADEFQSGTSTIRSIPFDLNSLQTSLVDREICETDENTLQLIPYITLMDEHGRVFCYSRGAESGELRLRTKLSIGLGGHMDVAPANSELLTELLALEAQRELQEETGLDHIDFHFRMLLIDRSDAVGRVHLGLPTLVPVRSDVVMTLESQVITNGQFLFPAELMENDVYQRLENWSKQVICNLDSI